VAGNGGGGGPPAAPPKVNHRSKHGVIQVLSVDDDAINQMVAATVLKSHKWAVVKCMNGMEVGAGGGGGGGSGALFAREGRPIGLRGSLNCR
jgi:hypothetical protein